MSDHRLALERIPIFQALTSDEFDDLAQHVEIGRYPKGAVLFEEGQPAQVVWLIQRGWVYLVKKTPSGQPVTVAIVTPAEIICGISALDQGAYSAGAIAATEVQVVKMPADAFARVLEQSGAVARQVLSICCTRIRHLAEASSLAQASVTQRLAYVLLRLNETFGKTVPITHKELAQMAGTRWETSIRTLARMKRQGWIASRRGQVTIIKPSALQLLLATPGNGREHQ